MFGTGINERLEENSLRKELIHHPFFKEVRSSSLDRETVGVFLGQWWHPLYFPHFLSRFTPGEIDRIVAGAEEMWSLWIGFFNRLRQVMFGAGELPVAEPVAVATA